MAANLPDSIADVLRSHTARPFDAAIKETLKEPGVLSKLWKMYGEAEVRLAFGSDSAGYQLPEASMTWSDQEFRSKQVTWRADLIARVGPSTILHVEQQTEHKTVDLSRRLMIYAAQIASYYDFKRKIIQIYYYTGDRRLNFERRRVNNSALIRNDRAAISNQFLAIDAGLHDANEMLKSGDFNFAVLGLLSMNIGDPRSYIQKLVRLAQDTFSGFERHHKLVHCMAIAFLRGRAELVWNAVSTVERNNMLRDPFWENLVNEHAGRLKQRALQVCRLVEELRAEFGTALADEDLEWLMDEFSLEDLETARENMKVAQFAAEVFQNTSFAKRRGRSPAPAPSGSANFRRRGK